MIIDKTGKYEKLITDRASKKDRENFDQYYYLYEYSDEIEVISDNPRYPSLLNYVKTGLITEEEMLTVLQQKQVAQ